MESIYEIMVEPDYINDTGSPDEGFYRKRKGLEVEEILKNLKKYLGIKTNVELSEILDVRPNTISTWKKRNSMDYSRLIAIGKSHKLDLNRLFSNKVKKETFNENVIVVPREFQYQYVTSFGEKEFLDGMPRYRFPFATGKGKIRIFQVDNITSFSSFKGNFFAVGELINGIGNITEDTVYIVVNKVSGISVGKIEQYDNDPDALYIVNNQNKIMRNKIRISAGDVVEIWEVNNIVFGKL
ncbi:helix-turn-helix domain containing protein [Sinomicrobium kalidii]|uniref:helix-turn-helix domain-containing protein n=1 Tax=Sinomicrobium kalidii TaxID=2900738 RepID=UPI001E32F3FE|nr:helix-turn-helix domain-containing protein [Sinomicrobium kalidii]UGU15903.1 helix-turn-helix domain containing protein [Sinomicrobium kalidii]